MKLKSVIFYALLQILLGVSNLFAQQPQWTLTPFVKQDAVNPILLPLQNTTFDCPVSKKSVHWEAKDVYNPAAIVRNGKVYLLYRAEDTLKSVDGTSRIGLAVSNDGIHFKRQAKPVLFPENDFMKPYEWAGGCEDPRIVETNNGRYIITYTTYDGKTARLCIATSSNLQKWKKQGLAFKQEKYRDLWSKSGAIICKRVGQKLIASKINGKYWMYFGDTNIFLASSDDLITWEILEDETGKPKPIFGAREGKFDSRLVESGPPAMITKKGILLLYNSMNLHEGGFAGLPPDAYSAGQILMDIKDPAKVIARTDDYFMKPEKSYELNGQVNQVVFIEGMVYFKNRFFLYYGTADSKIAVAVCKF
ncbi:MAG: glycoside hydrolase family 130 protein [Bacteroidota bacterium]